MKINAYDNMILSISISVVGVTGYAVTCVTVEPVVYAFFVS